MTKAIDIGTSFLVAARLKDGKEYFTVERNVFFAMPREDFSEEMLSKAGAHYVRKNGHLFVIGEDALKLSMLTGDQSCYRRPMARGVLNPGEEEAIGMMEKIIGGLLGRAETPDELVVAALPAQPIEGELDTTFHQIVVRRCLEQLGYRVRTINEAQAVVFYDNPTLQTATETVPFTGIGMSFGGGMTNICVSWRANKLFEMSCLRGGDWIDQRVADVVRMPVSRVTHIKEKRLDLDKIDRSDPVLMALDIYYDELIRYALQGFTRSFRNASAEIDDPLTLVVAGGTASIPGFVNRLKTQVSQMEMPIAVRDVRLAKEPRRAVAGGALVAALSAWSRGQDEERDPAARERARQSGLVASGAETKDSAAL
jgi:hypothetical protein